MSERVSLSQPQHQFIHAVDQRLRQLSQELLAPTPYLLEVPHGGFHHYSHQASDWRRSCPFGSNEEQLQYLTFRPEFDKDTVLQAKGDWDDGKGNITNTADKPSGPNTPLPGQLAKKKITLSDYKNKAAGQASVSAVMPKKTNEESKPSLKASDPESLSPPQSKAQPKLQHHGVKRSAERLVESFDLKQHATHHSPPTKKARLPSHTMPDAQPAETTPPAVEKPTLWDLPPMLSPTLPPDIEEELARMPNEGVLSGQKKVISTARPTAEKKLPPSALTSKEGPRMVKKITKEAKQNPDEAERGVATPKDLKSKLAQEKNTRPTTNGLISHTITNGAINSKSSMHDLVVEGKKSTLSPPASISTTPKSERKRLIVKLKIPKPIRKNIIRILQMQPRPSPRLGRGTFRSDRKDGANDVLRGKDLRRGTSQESEQQTPKSDQTKTKNTPTINSKKSKVPEDNSNVPRSGEKRKRQDDQDSTPDPSSKRQKHPGGFDPSQKPHTPIRLPMRSPLGSQSNSAHKSQLSTPMREMKGTAMHRIGSSEGDVKTPLGTARDGTPANGTIDRVNRDGRSSSNTSGDLLGSRNEEIAAWKSEKKRYEMLGRTLKHEAKAALLNDSKSEFKIDTASLRYGAAIAFETVLSFFLAFTIGDEINRLSRLPNDITAWRTLVPFVRYVERVTIIYRPLFGLTQQLEAVCRDTISLFDAERLERDANIGGLVDDQRPSTANSSENHPSPMALEKSKPDPAASEKAKPDPAVELAENLRQAQLKWQLGHTECSVRELQRSFPETWNKSAELPGPGKGKEKLSPKNYGNGTYYLPLGPSTSTIEGARVGWQMLGEWCKQNEVKWEGKLGL